MTVLGTAGVGKSRLVEEFTGSLGDRATVLRGRCLPYGEGITYWPLNEVVRDLAAEAGSGAPAEVRDALAAHLAGDPKAALVADVLAQAVGLGDTGGYPAEKIRWAARRLFELLAERRPVVVVLDDLQWAEATFLDLIEHVADLARDAPVLLLCLTRPELLDNRRGWAGGKLNATSVLLEPLSLEESRELVDNLVEELEPDAAARIAAASDGHPLFAEELLAMLIDEGMLMRDRAAGRRGSSRALPVPPTIQALLGARIERLTARRPLGARARRGGGTTLFAQCGARPCSNGRRRGPRRAPRVAGKLGQREAHRDRRRLACSASGGVALPPRTDPRRCVPAPAQGNNRAELHGRLRRLGRGSGRTADSAEHDETIGWHLEQAWLLPLGARATRTTPPSRSPRAPADRLESAGRRALRRSDAPGRGKSPGAGRGG